MTNHADIYDAVRTPRSKGKKDGSLHEVKPIGLGAGLPNMASVLTIQRSLLTRSLRVKPSNKHSKIDHWHCRWSEVYEVKYANIY
jgi:hypothetical protein|tara:strand:- start:12 stop:266 length:255 start_codon:yes stop_codon:yes gene_type:complete